MDNVRCLERGLPRAADTEASSPATFFGSPDELSETLYNVAWSLPSGGITGGLGCPLSKHLTPYNIKSKIFCFKGLNYG